MSAVEQYEQVKADIADWLVGSGQPEDLPASAALFALDCHGCESNRIGTGDALMAVSDECDECYGEGSHCDDSHPGNRSWTCGACDGHGRVPKVLHDVQHAQDHDHDQHDQQDRQDGLKRDGDGADQEHQECGHGPHLGREG